MFEAGQFDVAHLIYPVFRNSLTQEPVSTQLIPVPAPTDSASGGAVVEYEPAAEALLAELLPRYIQTQLLGSQLDRAASEQGRPRTAQYLANHNAADLNNHNT